MYHLDRTNVASLEFTNDGPLGTRNYAIGDGVLAGNWGLIDEYIPSSERFRTIETVTRFGRVKDRDALQKLADSEAGRTKEPVLSVNLTVYPDTIPNFWAKLDTGIKVTVDYNFGFHDLNSDPDDASSFTFWRVKGYNLKVNRQGDPVVSFNMHRVRMRDQPRNDDNLIESLYRTNRAQAQQFEDIWNKLPNAPILKHTTQVPAEPSQGMLVVDPVGRGFCFYLGTEWICLWSNPPVHAIKVYGDTKNNAVKEGAFRFDVEQDLAD